MSLPSLSSLPPSRSLSRLEMTRSIRSIEWDGKNLCGDFPSGRVIACCPFSSACCSSKGQATSPASRVSLPAQPGMISTNDAPAALPQGSTHKPRCLASAPRALRVLRPGGPLGHVFPRKSTWLTDSAIACVVSDALHNYAGSQERVPAGAGERYWLACASALTSVVVLVSFKHAAMSYLQRALGYYTGSFLQTPVTTKCSRACRHNARGTDRLMKSKSCTMRSHTCSMT